VEAGSDRLAGFAKSDKSNFRLTFVHRVIPGIPRRCAPIAANDRSFVTGLLYGSRPAVELTSALTIGE
jgi:hypothetical protein